MNRAVFESWLSRHCDYDDLSKSEIELAYEAWQAAFESPEVQALHKDAERYRLLRRGQHWSVINGIGDELRSDALDAYIDTAREK